MNLSNKKQKIITIAGSLGSGKSSTADLVAKKLGFQRFSSGDFMRQMAQAKGLSLSQLSKEAEQNQVIDQTIDQAIQNLKDKNELVIDSRLAFHWIPNSFKIYLNLSPEIAKERIWQNLTENKLRKESENYLNQEEVYQRILDRMASEKKRYQQMYQLDPTNKNNFDLIIDTSKNNLEQVVNEIVLKYKEWIKN